MKINRKYIMLMVLIAFIGIIGANLNNNEVYGAEKWIKYNQSNVYMTDLYATVHVTIKNNNNHVEYFKISQTYTDDLDTPISWKIISKPGAVQMVDAVSPDLDGDYGWKIQPGQTKTVSFTLEAVNSSTMSPLIFYLYNKGAVENTYWPLIPDPGLATSWFQPNEIETLNPDLDLKYWKGSFSFDLLNINSESVSGIVRAPIVPLDSKLIASDPKATFIDDDMVYNGNVAAWDVTLGGEGARHYTYTYLWSSSSSSSSGTEKYSSSIPSTSAASTNSATSTKDTGVPYLPFAIGGILAAGGLAYARLR